MAMGIIGLAVLTGTPITGAMVSWFGGYDEAMVFSGSGYARWLDSGALCGVDVWSEASMGTLERLREG